MLSLPTPCLGLAECILEDPAVCKKRTETNADAAIHIHVEIDGRNRVLVRWTDIQRVNLFIVFNNTRNIR
jgi:hypothetical protein